MNSKAEYIKALLSNPAYIENLRSHKDASMTRDEVIEAMNKGMARAILTAEDIARAISELENAL